jgi:hypothetical protein
MLVFNMQPQRKVVTKLDVCCFNLVKAESVQESLFETSREREVSKVLDNINNKWGSGQFILHECSAGKKKSLTESLLAE